MRYLSLSLVCLAMVAAGFVGCSKKSGNVAATPAAAPIVSATPPPTAPPGRWGIALKNINKDVFKLMMRDLGGFCDQYTWNFGNAKCDAYAGAGYIIIQSSGGLATDISLTIGAGANSPNATSGSVWNQIMAVPIVMTARVSPINNNAGFEFRASSTRGFNSFANEQLIGYVQTGTLNDNVLNVELHYSGQHMADAAAQRY